MPRVLGTNANQAKFTKGTNERFSLEKKIGEAVKANLNSHVMTLNNMPTVVVDYYQLNTSSTTFTSTGMTEGRSVERYNVIRNYVLYNRTSEEINRDAEDGGDERESRIMLDRQVSYVVDNAIMPNEGDHIRIKTTTNKEMVYIVTGEIPTRLIDNEVREITYEHDVATTVSKLESQVELDYTFIPGTPVGHSPLVLTSRYALLQDLKETYDRLSRHYCDAFYDDTLDALRMVHPFFRESPVLKGVHVIYPPLYHLAEEGNVIKYYHIGENSMSLELPVRTEYLKSYYDTSIYNKMKLRKFRLRGQITSTEDTNKMLEYSGQYHEYMKQNTLFSSYLYETMGSLNYHTRGTMMYTEGDIYKMNGAVRDMIAYRDHNNTTGHEIVFDFQDEPEEIYNSKYQYNTSMLGGYYTFDKVLYDFTSPFLLHGVLYLMPPIKSIDHNLLPPSFIPEKASYFNYEITCGAITRVLDEYMDDNIDGIMKVFVDRFKDYSLNNRNMDHYIGYPLVMMAVKYALDKSNAVVVKTY